MTSHTLDKAEWAPTTILSTDIPAQVEELKRQPGRELQIHGSARLGQSLLAAGLIDEVRLAIAPVILGHGRGYSEVAPQPACGCSATRRHHPVSRSTSTKPQNFRNTEPTAQHDPGLGLAEPAPRWVQERRVCSPRDRVRAKLVWTPTPCAARLEPVIDCQRARKSGARYGRYQTKFLVLECCITTVVSSRRRRDLVVVIAAVDWVREPGFIASFSSNQTSPRSFHSGFRLSINATLCERHHALICFSRAIASRTSENGAA